MEAILNYLVPTIHVLSCLFLIVVVLLQTGKGADMGAVFGGGSQTLFGSGGAGNLLTKLTTGTAITFMVTSLILSGWQQRGGSSSLLDKVPGDAGIPAATAPAPTPETPSATDGGAAGEKTAATPPPPGAGTDATPPATPPAGAQ